MALSHDGASLLFSCGWDQTVRVWPPRPPRTSGAPPVGAERVLLHETAVLAVAVLIDGRLVSGAGDGKVTLWTRDGAGELAESASCRVATPVRGLASLPDGGFGQVGNDGVLRTFTSAATPVHASPSAGCYLFCVSSLASAANSGRSSQLAAGGDDGVVRIWEAAAATPLTLLQEVRTPGDVYALSVLPSGDLLCAADEAGAFLFTRRPGAASPPAEQKALAAAAVAFAAPQPPGALPPPPPGAVPPGGGGGGGGGSSGGSVVNGISYDFVFPVEMGRGNTQIYWNRGDDVEVIAAQFALREGVGMDELGSVKEFIMTAMGQAGGGGAGTTGIGASGASGGATAAAASPPPAAQQAALIGQLTSMGFPDSQAVAALERAGWSVEGALGVLLG